MSSFSMPVPSREETRRGIAYMVGAVFVFAVVNALVKWEIALYPLSEVVFFRCLFALVPCVVLVATHGGPGVLRTRRPLAHVSRAFVQFLSMCAIFTAFGLMPLADAVSISFSAPLFLTVLSIPILGERVGVHRWGAVLVGFLGVLIMVRPGAGVLEAGAVFALVNAFLSASVTISLRRMSVTESSVTLVVWQVATTVVLSTLLLPFGWVAPTLRDAAIMALVGLASGVGQYMWTQAFRFAPAAVAAPFSYTAMIWAMGLGYLIWGDLPTPALVGGALVVAGSGLYILYRETIRRRSPVQAPITASPGDD